MFPFINGESREVSRGGFLHENDPGRRTIMSRIFSIFNNVSNLEQTPEVRTILFNRQNTAYANVSYEQNLPVEELGASALTPEDIMSQAPISETVEPAHGPKSLEEIRREVAEHAEPIGSRAGVPPDVAKSIEGVHDERLAHGA